MNVKARNGLTLVELIVVMAILWLYENHRSITNGVGFDYSRLVGAGSSGENGRTSELV